MLNPRPAVLSMAPYHPPTGNRADKLRLDFNENTVGCSPAVIEALRRALTPEALTIYPDYAAARLKLASYFQVDEREILLTNGTDEAIQVLINTYVDDPDEVIQLRPSYAMYRFYAEVAGARVIDVPYAAPALEFPLEAVLNAIKPATRAILISNPNNPTGTATTVDCIERILRAAPQAAVLIDEAYHEFCGITALAKIGEFRNLFVSRTFSKAYGMAAMRMGCLFSHAANIEYMHKTQSQYSVNALAVVAAQAAIEDSTYLLKYIRESHNAQDVLYAGLRRLGIQYVQSSANFVLGYFGSRAVEVRDALREKAILVRDRSYEIPGGIRITVGTCEQARRVIAELERIW